MFGGWGEHGLTAVQGLGVQGFWFGFSGLGLRAEGGCRGGAGGLLPDIFKGFFASSAFKRDQIKLMWSSGLFSQP